ncbi:MAG TPA: PEGA domain-containing protein [Anaeromyxobacter sp.]
MTRRIAAALVLAALAAALPARADDVAEAKARFRKGVELYRERRFRDAAAEFEAAYRLKPHGAIHFNLAQCRERLDEWPGALRSYHDYLREVPDATDRVAVRAAMRRIEERLAATGVQVLLVYTDPPGAKVSLDGRERGKAPLHLVLAPGTYALALALEGYEAAAEPIEVSAGASRLVDVVLRPAARAPAAASPATSAAPDLAARPPASPPAPPSAPAPPPARTRRHLAAWIAAGTAVAAAAAGALVGWSARSDARAIDALAAPDPAAASRRARDAEAKARTANALYAVAGGAAAAGGTLFVLEGRF